MTPAGLRRGDGHATCRRAFGRRRALHKVSFSSRPRARSSACWAPTAPASPRCSASCPRCCARPPARWPTAAPTAPDAARAAIAHRRPRPRPLPLPRADRAREPAVLRRPLRRRGRGRARGRGAGARPASRPAPTNPRRPTRGACGSAWRWSARSSTRRGWSCSTSRSPASTTRRPRRSSSVCAACGTTAASSSWPRTIWTWPTACWISALFLRDGRVVHAVARPDAAARHLSGEWWADDDAGASASTVLADRPQGLDGRGPQPRDRLHDALLRGVVPARLRVRHRARREGARRSRGGHPVGHR